MFPLLTGLTKKMTEAEGKNQNRDDDDGNSPSSVSVSDNNNTSSLLLLTEQLRKGTREVHDQSDKLVNLKLAMVLTSKPLYAEAISLFWPIYAELEILIEKHQHHPQLKFLFPLLPILRRSPYFIQDISYLLNNDKTCVEELKNRRRMIQKSSEDGNNVTTTSTTTTSIIYSPPELQEYIDHLRLISESDDPVILIAYINAMYGAIMAGGAIIKRAVQSAFSLSKNSNDDGGVEIFVVNLDNTQYKNIADFRKSMKQIINEDIAPTLSPTQHEQILKEANQVFIRNNKLVATVKDTRAFSIAWKRFQTYALVVVTILVVVLAIYWKKK